MGVPHAIEFSSPDGLLSIDIVARCGDGSPLAIEVDGVDHFTCLPPYRPLGHTIIRNQMIASLGFKGVGIPFYDWQSLASQTDKVSYVTARLAKWGISPFEATQAGWWCPAMMYHLCSQVLFDLRESLVASCSEMRQEDLSNITKTAQ